MSAFVIPAVHRAVPLLETGAASVLKVIEKAAPQAANLADGGIIVNNKVSSINVADVLRRAGRFPIPTPPGTVLGAEAAGVVVASRNPGFNVGDRVAFNVATQGCYADYVQIDKPATVNKIPDDVSFETAASSQVAGLMSLSLLKAHTPKPGQTIVVWSAAGGVGQSLIRLASKVHGAKVIGVTSTEIKAKLAKEAGADEVVIVPRGVAVEKIDDHPLVKRVKEVTDGKGVDAVFDGVGKDAFEASLASLGVGAALIQYGVVSGPSPPLDTMRLSAKINSVQFHTVVHDMTRPGGYEELTGALYKHLQSGLLKVPIYPSYKLEEIAEAHAAVESGTAYGKVIITI
ncbi:NAD(P)-binding protein [Ramicandelaber brevisporus]|nr:NAD(P)-binding protein [Ramicandelaber brevisporus]